MKNISPLVSVVIPSYNHSRYIKDSVQSIINQTYENIELIIIDDGSTDNSILEIKTILDSCEKRFVRFEFRSRQNIGLSATLNEALKWCEGKYYSAIASDDQMLVNKTATQVNFLENNLEYVAVFGNVQLIDEHNNKLEKIEKPAKSYDFDEIIMHKHHLLAPTQMIRLQLIKNVGGFNAKFYIEDWYMWLKLSQRGKVFSMDELFALYRKHDNNISKNYVKMQEGRLEVLREFKEYKYYNKAVQKTKWVNTIENFMSKGKLKYYADSFMISPIRTIKITHNYINKRIKNAKKSIF